MVKYIRAVVFGLATVISLSTVVIVTKDKLSGLQAQRLATPTSFASVKDRERQLICMAQNVYWEAASEPAEGKLAVAQIVMNRAESGRFPTDPCQVIFQKNVFYEKVVCQFSWYCETSYKVKVVRQDLWDESYLAAKMVLMEGFRLPSLKGALYYHADYVNPQWKKQQVAKIGRHIFYKDKA